MAPETGWFGEDALDRVDTCGHRRAGHVESGSVDAGMFAAARVCSNPVCQRRALRWVAHTTGYGLASARFVADPPGYLELARRWVAEARMRWSLEDGVAE